MARPRKEIDKTNFEKLCGLQCTKDEICGFFDVTDKTLENWCKRTYNAGFSEVFAIKRGAGKISLRRYQMELAKKSASMAIFLGKNYLGQKDIVIDEDPESLKRLRALLAQVPSVIGEDKHEPDDKTG